MLGGRKTVKLKFSLKPCVFNGRRDFGHAVSLYNENHVIVAWFKRGKADEKESSDCGKMETTCQSKKAQ